jgi:hypothetical protein
VLRNLVLAVAEERVPSRFRGRVINSSRNLQTP